MNFNSIIGQSVLIGSLKRAVQQDMVANGYIFCGPKGSGKRLAAAVFARALNCRSQEHNRPCGDCTSCRKFDSGNHPNLEIIKPSGASIKIKQIREVISHVAKKPYESGYKVVIIEEADKMTQDAQDAFLKTLEEPPANTIFILLVQNHNSLLSTVVSRCQVFYMRKVPTQQIESYLTENYKYDRDQIVFAAVSANGIIGRAIDILNNKELQGTRRHYVSLVSKLAESSYTDMSAAAGELLESKESVENFLDFLLSWYRDLLICRQGCDRQILINSDNADIIEGQSQRLDENRLHRIIDVIKRTINYVNHNVGTKNSIDSMLLNIMEVYNG